MCGRFLNKLPPEETARLFRTKGVAPNYPARFNIAPTDPILAVRFDPKSGQRSLDALRWGLVPHFAKDLSMGARFINARAETVATLPAFRDAFKRHRCLIPASGFYEWRKDGKTKTPYAIVPTDGPLFAFAGPRKSRPSKFPLSPRIEQLKRIRAKLYGEQPLSPSPASPPRSKSRK